MNEPNPSLPADYPPLPPLPEKRELPARLPRLLLSLIVVVAAFDLCFWGAEGLGLSLAFFVPVLAGTVLLNGQAFPRPGRLGLVLALLLGAAGMTAYQTGITNFCVLLVLLPVLAGEVFFPEVASSWGRWLSQGIALVMAPGRIFWLGGAFWDATRSKGLGWTSGLLGGLLLAIPAVLLALVFGALLASGNAVFGNWLNTFFDWAWNELAACLDLGRIVMWLCVAFFALPLLRPAAVSTWWWSWVERLPRLPRVLPSNSAAFSSVLVLILLNLLFFIANLTDLLFLWNGHVMPDGVSYKQYVHEGTASLIAAVLLTGFVLAAIFQQEEGVARRGYLKVLALIWIAQNIFLLVSVALRVERYITGFILTVDRLSLFIFFILVVIGYVLLTVKIIKERSLSWLVGGGLLASFATIYITQFLDLGGWSAAYNEARWEKDRSIRLCVWYMYELGPDAWPALRRAHDLDPTIAIINADPKQGQVTQDTVSLAQFDAKHWQAFSAKAWLNRGALEEGSSQN